MNVRRHPAPALLLAALLASFALAAPAGAKTVMGLDPGLRTGVKVAVVDATVDAVKRQVRWLIDKPEAFPLVLDLAIAFGNDEERIHTFDRVGRIDGQETAGSAQEHQGSGS